ncbi:urease subunit beta [Sporolactobacillus sp. Y61]|uniref:Urease subunit beta n=1 Tax=Sporolactobacillus sp. Y61 TaxID=3160863 RepID=A0AAU8IGP0_9BACL
MIPGEYMLQEGEIKCNTGHQTKRMKVFNRGDRPIQVGSHHHFYEVNEALKFDRNAAFGYRLNIPAGLAVRFEPGDGKTIELVELGGEKRVYGLNDKTNGKTDGGLQ